MLANLPVEIILLICEYPEFKDLGQLARANKRTMRIIKKYLPIALVLERKIFFYLPYKSSNIWEGGICLFDSHTNSVKQITTFTNYLWPWEVATTKDKIFGIGPSEKIFGIFDLNTRQISRGPDPPEWRNGASVAYFKGKLYYLGGVDPKIRQKTNRVDVLIDGKWEIGPAFPLPIRWVQTITCDGILYVIDGRKSKMVYRLSDDEREWIEIGEIPKRRGFFGVASLNGKIYITGGENDHVVDNIVVFNSCLCFDPSDPADSRISEIAYMNYARKNHSLIVSNGKLYAIGGFKKKDMEDFCNSIEEYNPQTKKWKIVREILTTVPTTIGIDLGTTFSCVAIANAVSNDPEPVANNFGNRITPSVIAYDPKNPSTLIGEAAMNSGLDPTNIIYDAKRMIGRQANDASIEKDKKLWPFRVESKEGRPHVKLMHNGNERLIPPEQISSEVLKEMKAIAERFLSTNVTHAVITVPAYFDHQQKVETSRAAEIAGLKVFKLISEPTAAVIAYMNKDKYDLNGKTVMVFDLGGGAFNVSIVKVDNGIKVIAIDGHDHLGGQDFDELIMEYVKKCYRERTNRDFPTNRPKLLNRLRLNCREAKHILSWREQPTPITIEVNEDEDFTCQLTKAKLNEMIDPMLRDTLDIVDKAIQQAGMKTDSIDLVLLIGGSTRIPKIQELLAGKFGQDKLRYRINPDEAVAIGAALITQNLDEFTGFADHH